MKEIHFRAAQLLECVGEPIRFQIICHLQNGPCSVGKLARLTKRHQTTVCQHLAALRSFQVVRYRNRKQFTFYELKLKSVVSLLELAVQCAGQAGAGVPQTG